MSRLTLVQGLLMNLSGQIEKGRREYLPREEAYEHLKRLTGRDFGYDVVKWKAWFKGDASQAFHKALLLLDRGAMERGEHLLRKVIMQSEQSNEILYYRACCCLGELLYETERKDEAVPLLERVASLETSDHYQDKYDDLLDYEIARARQLLKTQGRA